MIVSFCARVAESPCATVGLIKAVHRQPLGSAVAGNNHLADALTVLNGLWLITQVDKNNTDFAAIVGIDGARGVEHCQSPFQGKTAARADLALTPLGQRDINARVHEGTLQGLQRQGLLEPCPQVHAGAQRRGILRHAMRPLVHYLHFDLVHVGRYLLAQNYTKNGNSNLFHDRNNPQSTQITRWSLTIFITDRKKTSHLL